MKLAGRLRSSSFRESDFRRARVRTNLRARETLDREAAREKMAAGTARVFSTGRQREQRFPRRAMIFSGIPRRYVRGRPTKAKPAHRETGRAARDRKEPSASRARRDRDRE